MRIVTTLIAAAVAGQLFDHFDVPGGTIIGAVVGAAAYSLISGGAEATLPRPVVSAAYVSPEGVIRATSPGTLSAMAGASYSTTNEWPGGFQGEVTVTAGNSAISGWSVNWTFGNGQSITRRGTPTSNRPGRRSQRPTSATTAA